MAGGRTHLDRLEAESIDIFREAVAESERPVLLYSIGKDSSTMLHLARKAFYPSPPPFPLLHVDTTWKFREMIEFRDQTAARLGLELIVHRNPECLALGINPFDHGSATHTDLWKTQGLRQALDKHRFDLAFGGARRDEETLRMNEIAIGTVYFDQPVAFDAYRDNRDLGGFIVIDRLTNATVGAGLLRSASRSTDVRWQATTVDKHMRAGLKGQRGCVVWFTGLSGAGKSTIANLVEQRLNHDDRHTYLLDGDNVRHGLNKDLGFTDADRVENVRRVAEVAGLMVDAGLIVLVAFISPFRAERALAREIVATGEFCEVYVDTPLSVAEQRDPKGLYAKARRGELPNFTGIDSPYEPPERPELRLDTTQYPAEQSAAAVLDQLRRMGITSA